MVVLGGAAVVGHLGSSRIGDDQSRPGADTAGIDGLPEAVTQAQGHGVFGVARVGGQRQAVRIVGLQRCQVLLHQALETGPLATTGRPGSRRGGKNHRGQRNRTKFEQLHECTSLGFAA